MKITPRELARVLYLAAKDLSKPAAEAVVKRFVNMARTRGWAPLLNEALIQLPAVADRVDGIEGVTVETARPQDGKIIGALLRAVGLEPERAVVTVKVVPELVSGARVRRTDLVLDLSGRRQLERLRRPSKDGA
ncbi:hypothetical protein A3C96_04070 [Candidatus Uhrbacteria bacterium RIFCSPHIGHO2_02_FULL_60_10]|uniref:Uncharacterized protein n=1 Tax=Candidatus Uhrbacteria bacterium RIFCSPHIGHO2_02_FULL_60_10 TaxID=1802392 RepID=A0A1F7UA17_9BACT|nr:MAG: hypothetical protein A3C96_04070 [Candidatus Uhrbacteria bacterium RIFCSPHIGHO2_02_FULL_60_10]